MIRQENARKLRQEKISKMNEVVKPSNSPKKFNRSSSAETSNFYAKNKMSMTTFANAIKNIHNDLVNLRID